MTGNRKLFDEAAATWDDKPDRVEHARVVADAALDMARPSSDAVVLDYGCGTGTLAVGLAKHVAKVIAADTSRGMLEQLERKLEEHGIENVYPFHLPSETDRKFDTKFDLIVISMTLHHVADAQSLLRLFADSLNPNGKLFIADLAEEDGSFHSDMKVPHWGFNPDKLADLLREIGLTTTSVRVIREIDKNDKKYPVFALLAENISADL